MKNTLNIKREFGSVIIESCLPSLEDFCRRVSRNTVEQILGRHFSADESNPFYCDALTHSYIMNMDIFRDFNSIIEKRDLLALRYHWGDIQLADEECLNLVPFVSRGIGEPQTLNFIGMYSVETLTKVKETLEALVEYIKNYRKPVVFSFEIDIEDETEAEVITL